jgi:galactose mutarotase-like enzyme
VELRTRGKLTSGRVWHCAAIHAGRILRGINNEKASSGYDAAVTIFIEAGPVSDQRNAWIPVSSAELSAAIDPMGAQLSVLRDRDGRDLLWDGDPAIWAGRAPLLFPTVGNLAAGSYRLGSKTYHLPRHGFARTKPFEVVETTAAGATFRLKADEETLRVYPFRFELDVSFAIDGPSLLVTMTARNAGDADMPASFGYHPAFRWPLPYQQPRAAHFLEFAQSEPAPIKRLNTDGLLEAAGRTTPVVGRRMALRDELFKDDVVIFDQLNSHSVTHGADTGPRLRVSYPDASYLGIWTKPGAEFVCIEPWRGIADPAGFTGDFTRKPGVFIVSPGAAQSIKMEITLLRG